MNRRLDPIFDLPVEVLAEGLAHTEGGDRLPDGRILFVETFRGQVSAWSAGPGVEPFAVIGGGPNSCAVGTDGVYVAQNGGTAGPWKAPERVTPSIQRIEPDGSVVTVADDVDGQALLAPNDLAFGPDGRLYFTDPGEFDPADPDDGRLCALDRDGTVSILVEPGPVYPNGVAVEPDGAVLWTESFTRRIRRLRPDGAIEEVATLPQDRIPDGLKLARDGTMFVAGVTSGGVDVVARDGELRGFIRTGGAPQNCVFDGADLYVADFGDAGPEADEGVPVTCGRLLRVRCPIAGRPLYRGAIAAAR